MLPYWHDVIVPTIKVMSFVVGKCKSTAITINFGERGRSVVERLTPEGEVGGLKPTSAMLCP